MVLLEGGGDGEGVDGDEDAGGDGDGGEGAELDEFPGEDGDGAGDELSGGPLNADTCADSCRD